MMSGGCGTENEDAGSKKNSKTTGGTFVPNSLLEGNYDEGESHNAFLDALNAWRGGGKVGDDPKKSVDKGEKVSIIK